MHDCAAARIALPRGFNSKCMYAPQDPYYLTVQHLQCMWPKRPNIARPPPKRNSTKKSSNALPYRAQNRILKIVFKLAYMPHTALPYWSHNSFNNPSTNRAKFKKTHHAKLHIASQNGNMRGSTPCIAWPCCIKTTWMPHNIYRLTMWNTKWQHLT